mmetsp:Transcript_9252/g.38914  ORF Transcript_9252/g.38914 Transcript_9252/m.38914 type:complete len:358 (-) Transcript_9252:72-1145(-)
MADGALRGTHRHFAISESRPEHVKQRVTLRLVPGARPGGVRVDVVHVVRGKAGVRQRRAHRARRAGAVRGRLRDVERVRALPEPPNLGVDLLCAARSRVLQTLNNQHTRALADHEPGTGRVERTARRRVRVFLFRVVFVVVLVVSRQRVHLCFFDALRVQPRLVQGVNRAVRFLRRRRRRRHQRFVRPTLFPAKRFLVRRILGVARVGRVGTRRLVFAAVLFVPRALAFQETRVFRTGQRDPRALGFQLASQRLAFAHLLAHPVAPLQERQGLVAHQLRRVQPGHHPGALLALTLILLHLGEFPLLRLGELLHHGQRVAAPRTVLRPAAAARLLFLLRARQHRIAARHAERRGELRG